MSWPPTPHTFSISPTLKFTLREVYPHPQVERGATDNAVIELRDDTLSESPPSELVGKVYGPRKYTRAIRRGLTQSLGSS